MISGRQALGTIEQAIAQARSQEAQLEAAFQAAADEAARLRTQRAEAFRDLARIKLDSMSRDQVVGELDAAERRALALLSNRRQALEQSNARRHAAEAAVQEAERVRHARAEAFEQALRAIQDMRQKVEREAGTVAEWAAQRARIEDSIRVVGEAEKKALQAERDREEKRKPYESDPLFMYLWKRRFGTAEDRSGPFVRFFDRAVARLVGYDKARANYAMLNEIPQRLRDHVERVKAEVGAARARLTAIERGELVKAGIEPLEARARDAKAALDDAEQALAEARAALAALDREHDSSLDEAGDPAYREAVELLASADSRQDLRVLYQEALQTPTPKDEAVIRQIEATEAAIGQAEQRTGGVLSEMRELAKRRAAIEHERDAFRRQGYDNPWGGFANGNILGSVVGGILGGMIQGSVLRDTLRDGYQQEPGPWDSGFGGGFSTDGGPWGAPSDGGGIFDGGGMFDGGGDGFGTGGSFGGDGGGFRTGGSF